MLFIAGVLVGGLIMFAAVTFYFEHHTRIL